MAEPLQHALDRIAGGSRRGTGEVLFSVVRGADAQEQAFSGDPDRLFFLASGTKLYVTALLVQLRAEGLVDFDEPFVRYLPGIDTAGMHVLHGTDRTGEITVRQLMQHTSGLPDYFEDRRLDGSTTHGRMLDADFGWDLHDVVRWTREELQPAFSPGAPGRAAYSDTNYQLLGGIIEQQLGATFAGAVRQRICEPLGLDSTFCLDRASLDRYRSVAPFHQGRHRVDAPLAMASFGPDGGMVSTLRESQRFLRAFFDGTLIPFEVLLGELCRDFRPVFGRVLRSGTGVMRYQPPFVLPGRPNPPLDGHPGVTGVVMFLDQATGTSVVGTVNQIKRRWVPYRMLSQLIAAA